MLYSTFFSADVLNRTENLLIFVILKHCIFAVAVMETFAGISEAGLFSSNDITTEDGQSVDKAISLLRHGRLSAEFMK